MPLDVISYSEVKKLGKTVKPTGDILPPLDNTYSLGSADKRWKSVYVVDVYTGDIKLQNGWIITERDEQGNLINGVRILNDKGEEIFKITENGIYFKGKRLKLIYEE